MGVDYYKLLGLDKNASQDDIKKAYRKVGPCDRSGLCKSHQDKERRKEMGAEVLAGLGAALVRDKGDAEWIRWQRMEKGVRARTQRCCTLAVA